MLVPLSLACNSKLLAFEHARWKKDWLKASSELAHDLRAWNAFVRDVVNLVRGEGVACPQALTPSCYLSS